jgi:hypothetical protein
MRPIRAAATVAAVDRAWAEAVAVETLAVFTALPLDAEGHPLLRAAPLSPDLVLVGGSPGRPGAHYRLTDTDAGKAHDITFTGWDAHSLHLRVGDGDAGGTVRVEAEAVLTGARAGLTMTGSDHDGTKVGLTWSAEASFERWWRPAGGGRAGSRRSPRTAPAVLATVSHRLLSGRIEARCSPAPAPAAQPSWVLEVAVHPRGRGLTRPLVAVALLVARHALDRRLATFLQGMARQWNEELPEWTGLPRAETAERVLMLLATELLPSEAAPTPP